MIPQISTIQLYLSIRIIADSWNMLDTVMYTKVFIFFSSHSTMPLQIRLRYSSLLIVHPETRQELE